MISRCKFCKNGFFNTFFSLSHTFYFETRPSPLSKIKENAFCAHFLQLYRKNEYGDPHFLFHDFNKDSASFLVQLLSTKIVHFYDKSMKLCQITTNPKTNIHRTNITKGPYMFASNFGRQQHREERIMTENPLCKV